MKIEESKEIAVTSRALASDFLIAAIFPKSRAKWYPLAIHHGLNATYQKTEVVDKFTFHFVGFNKDTINHAYSLLELLLSCKEAEVYCLGQKMQNIRQISEITTCYIQSETCQDKSAHCNVIRVGDFDLEKRFSEASKILKMPTIVWDKDNPSIISVEPEHPQYLMPCRYLNNRLRNTEISEQHPSSIEMQLQASAVRNGCAWCPNFNVHTYKKI